MRNAITLACTDCKQRNYQTNKNKKNNPDRIEMMKYCKFCGKHTMQQRGGFGKFFRGVKAELKKVVWPTKKELINYTIVVFLVTIFIAFIIYILDAVFAQLFNTLLHFVG